MNLGPKVQFVQSDLFENIKGGFDLIISNPPYIPTDVIKTLSPEVQSEPHIALDGGKDGLEKIQKIIDAAPGFLTEGGLVALETGYGQSEKVLKFFTSGSPLDKLLSTVPDDRDRVLCSAVSNYTCIFLYVPGTPGPAISALPAKGCIPLFGLKFWIIYLTAQSQVWKNS